MGLSKKLGGTAQKTGLPSSLAVPYKWSNQTYTVQEILKKFKLPCVVQCATDSCTVVWSDFQFDLRQPLLFYSKRSVQKVHALSVKQNNEVLEEIGPPLTIPEDYEGWFGAAPKGVSNAKRHFRIEGVANSNAHRFLVTTKCPAFTSSRDAVGCLRYMSHDIMPGEILKRVCLMESHPDDIDCPELVKLHGPCLECMDEKGEDVIIPLSHAVMSYEVAESYPEDEARVFKITSPIESGNCQLPRILTLIHGDPPLLAYAFTGMVRCYSVFTEETILAGTLEDPGSRCLELATDSCVKFRLGLNEAAVKKTCEYINAFQMCENFGAKFVTGIKVSFTLKPEMSNGGDLDVSPCESVSDMQEVEANSEFDIAWGSEKHARLCMASSSSSKDSTADTVADVKDLTGEITQKERTSVTDELSEVESESSAPVLPQHRDFTEQEIVSLMLKKGLVDPSESATEPPLELDVLKDNRVIDNPLFYFFQRNPEQKSRKTEEPENEESSSDESQEKETSTQNQKDPHNPLAYLFQKAPVQSSHTPEPQIPLSYLFEKHPGQTFASDRLENNISSDKTLQSRSQSSPHCPDLHKNHLGSESSTDISRYDQVVCKTARVYSGNNDDEDDNEDEDVADDSEEDSSESDEIFSDISEIYDNTRNLYYSKTVDMPNCKDKISTDVNLTKTSAQENSAKKMGDTLFNIKNASSVTYSNTDLTLSAADLMVEQTEETDLVPASDDEREAVDDLLALAARESGRDSGEGSHPKWSREHAIFSTSSTESKQQKTAEGDSVHRLNSLLEEVSELVNTSSGRILDTNKSHLHQDKISRTAVTGQDKPLIIPRLLTTKRADSYSTFPNAATTNLRNADDETPVVVYDKMAVIDQSQHQFDNSQLEKDEIKLKSDNVFNLFPGLNKSKSEDYKSVLRRSQAEVNLAHIDQTKVTDNCKTLSELRTTSPSESSISSIFSVVGRRKNKFDSSKMHYEPHDNHHRLSSETEDPASGFSSPTKLENAEYYQFPYKNQRILSLTRRNVLASAQSLERLNSTSGSSSSNYSSSLDCSFVQGVPKLVVIGDTNILINDRHSFTDESADEIAAICTHQYQKSARCSQELHSREGNTAEDWDEAYTVNEHYGASNTGTFQPSRFSMSQGAFLQIQNDDNGLQEDYV